MIMGLMAVCTLNKLISFLIKKKYIKLMDKFWENHLYQKLIEFLVIKIKLGDAYV